MTAGKQAHWAIYGCLMSMTMLAVGCTGFMAPRYPFPTTVPQPTSEADPPRELDKVSLPPYIIEPPDILLIQAIKVVPKPPHRIEVFDILLVRAANSIPDQPLDGAYSVGPDGQIDLGPTYGKVKVVGMTMDEAEQELNKNLARILESPEVTVSLAASAGAQQITGEHLVGPDGRVNLGTYGAVYVAGMTLAQAREAVEQQLSKELEDPEVILDIFAYNSKIYYVITEGAGFGDNIQRFPSTGNETVLDAIALLGGIPQVSSKKIWVARPAPNGMGCAQILPINYEAITRDGITATNYQLLPGDRLFIAEDKVVAFNSAVSKFTQPFERIFGFMSLGTATLNRIRRFGLGLNQ